MKPVLKICRKIGFFSGLYKQINIKIENLTELLCSMIWSLCCTTDEEGRKKLDSFIRDKEGVFPIKDTIYEYYVNVLHKCFAPWEEKLPFNWKFDPG